MTFWTPRKRRRAQPERPLWHLADGDRGTLTCVLTTTEGARVTLVVTGGGVEVASCTHPTRQEAIAHAGFLLDRLTAGGWQIVAAVQEMVAAQGSGAPMGAAADVVPAAPA